jgi:hypothetical protein
LRCRVAAVLAVNPQRERARAANREEARDLLAIGDARIYLLVSTAKCQSSSLNTVAALTVARALRGEARVDEKRFFGGDQVDLRAGHGAPGDTWHGRRHCLAAVLHAHLSGAA